MSRLCDQVRARDGRVLALRCARCGALFINHPAGTAWRAHTDHTWTHVDDARALTTTHGGDPR